MADADHTTTAEPAAGASAGPFDPNQIEYTISDIGDLADALYVMGRYIEDGGDQLPPRSIIGMARAFEALAKRADAQLKLIWPDLCDLRRQRGAAA